MSSREDGFAIADIDTNLFHDPKVIALARRLRDPAQTAAVMALYLATVLASWKAGEPLTVDEAAPAWWTGEFDQWTAHLVAVGLLDEVGLIPASAWQGWYGPAEQRRRDKSMGGQIGGLIAAGFTVEEAHAEAKRRRSVVADLKHRSRIGRGVFNPSVRPTGRSDRPVRSVLPRVREKAAGGQEPPPPSVEDTDFKDRLAANGLDPAIAEASQ